MGTVIVFLVIVLSFIAVAWWSIDLMFKQGVEEEELKQKKYSNMIAEEMEKNPNTRIKAFLVDETVVYSEYFKPVVIFKQLWTSEARAKKVREAWMANGVFYDEDGGAIPTCNIKRVVVEKKVYG